MKEPLSTVLNCDCLDYMKTIPDKFFSLSVVDVPYGMGVCKTGKWGGENCAKVTDYGAKDWDVSAPEYEYFNELFRITKNQIIWGANHFISKIPYDSPAWVVWDKQNGDNFFADCELAWTSFDSAVRIFRFRWAGMLQGNMKDKEKRIHINQKPVQLYKWLLRNYAKPGDTILDTHAGSMSSVIACIDGGFSITAMELDVDYYGAGKKRVMNHMAQLDCFIERPEIIWHDAE